MKTAIAKFTNRDQRGFTLIELLVVIAIIAILAALILAALNSAQKGSRDSRRQSDVSQYKTALANYYSDKNGYPAASNVNANTLATVDSSFTNYLSQFPPSPGGSGAQASYLYYGDANSFCISVQKERNTSEYIAASPSGQFGNKTGPCTAANTY